MDTGLSSNLNSNISSQLDIISNPNFNEFNPQIQGQLLANQNIQVEKSAGLLGKLLGINKVNLVVNSAFLICILLILLIIVDALYFVWSGNHINMDLVNLVIPVITLTLGYIFGKNT